MSTKTGSSRFLISVLFFILLTGCGGGGGDPESSAPPGATTLRLEPNTTYYFAVDAYNGVSEPNGIRVGGPCSTEVSTVTPSSGIVYLKWSPVQDPTIIAYDLHYGKQPSPGPPGDCTYTNSVQIPAQLL